MPIRIFPHFLNRIIRFSEIKHFCFFTLILLHIDIASPTEMICSSFFPVLIINKYRHSPILNPQSSILNHQSSILDPQSSIINPQSEPQVEPLNRARVGSWFEPQPCGSNVLKQ